METVRILLAIGLIAILSCSNVSGRRQGKRDFCQLSTERGRCKASTTRWFYDGASGECKEFTWGGCGGNANRFQAKSLCERVCKPGCRYERCVRTCPNGFIIDSEGCNSCRCQPASEPNSCPSVECPTTCSHGYQTDSAGCMTCDCRAEEAQLRVVRTSTKHQCPPVCYMYCQHGNKQDENGCDICSCKSKEEACGAEQCMMECPTGFATDSRGCETCECNPVSETGVDKHPQAPDCSKRPMCTLYCRYGFLKGRDGCDICRCARRSTESRHVRIGKRLGDASETSAVGNSSTSSKGCNKCNCRHGSTVHEGEVSAGNTGNSPAQLPANIPSQLPAQLPANIPSQLPAQLPANIPSQLPAQLPANIPAQHQADSPAQLPADIPAQLPANTSCSPKRCHKLKECSFGFAKDEDGCDTCTCSNDRSRRQ